MKNLALQEVGNFLVIVKRVRQTVWVPILDNQGNTVKISREFYNEQMSK